MINEYYEGVKFNTQFVSKSAPENIYTEDLRYWCKVFHDNGLTPPYEGGSSGNLSFREKKTENAFIITGSRIGLKHDLTDDKFVRVHACSIEKNSVYASGKIEPSSESLMHFAIYNQRKEINAIFHGHSPEILAHSSGLKLPVTHREEPYGSVKLAKSVLEVLEDHSVIIVKNHGFVALGKTMEEAGQITLDLLKKCRNL